MWLTAGGALYGCFCLCGCYSAPGIIEAHVCGELASSAVIVPGRKDKGTGVYIVRFFMYLPHAIALRASLAPGTLAFDDPVSVCSNTNGWRCE